MTKVASGIGMGIGVAVVLACCVVGPLTLWFAWNHDRGLVEPLVLTLFCAAFVWLNISILRRTRTLRRLRWAEPTKMAVGLGPRPVDVDELEAWNRGRQMLLAFAATVLAMGLFAVVKWASGDY
jgi:hypothetical protein